MTEFAATPTEDDDADARDGSPRAPVYLLCSHDQQHLSCMYRLLGNIDSHRALGV
jgi:hypothetical protein